MSFIRTMVEEKNLMDITFEINQDGVFHHISMMAVITFVENSSKEVISNVNSKLSEVEFKNGDILDFIKYLALGMIQV